MLIKEDECNLEENERFEEEENTKSTCFIEDNFTEV